MSDLNKVAESNDGTLYDSNGFLIAVLSGSYREMGAQYGALMVEHMQKAHDAVIEPGRKSGAITDNDAKKWTDRPSPRARRGPDSSTTVSSKDPAGRSTRWACMLVPSQKILLQKVGRRSNLNAAGAWGKDVARKRAFVFLMPKALRSNAIWRYPDERLHPDRQ